MTSQNDDVRLRDMQFAALGNDGRGWSDKIISIAKYLRNRITREQFGTPVAFVLVLIVIGTIDHAIGNRGEKGKPQIRFLAPRYYKEWWRDYGGESHNMTFESIHVNDGGGLQPNGSFMAPVDGLYW